MVATESLKDIVLDAAKEVFESMVFLSLDESTMAVDPSDQAFLARITFRGGIEGCLSVQCDPGGARRIAAGMLCSETPEGLSESEVVDALGEIANMVMGGVKTRLQDQIKDIVMSIPSVIQGRELSTRVGEGAVRLVIPVLVGQQNPVQMSLLYRTRQP
jgi:CheY-specific phosphatase CheX